jgi:hypothetical protein
MNLVKLIEDQLRGDVLNKLSSAIGADREETSAAASAAVPTLLSALVNQFSSADGTKRLSNVLSGFDSSGIGNYANLLGGDSSSLLNKGMGLLGSLFGDGLINTIANAIGRFSGLNAGAAKSLLAFLMPLVLGKVASQWKSQGGTPSALSNLLSDQKRHIADAIPDGFSLDDIPGMSVATHAAQSASYATRRGAETAGRAAPSIASWLIPVAVVLLGGFLLWNFLKPKAAEGPDVAGATPEGEKVVAMKPAIPDVPAVPTAAELSTELNTTFKTLSDTFASITDAESAEAAAPKLEELSRKIDTIKATMSKLPEAGRTTLQRAVAEQTAPLKAKAEETLAVPGLSDRIKALINQIVSKLEEWNIIERAG